MALRVPNGVTDARILRYGGCALAAGAQPGVARAAGAAGAGAAGGWGGRRAAGGGAGAEPAGSLRRPVDPARGLRPARAGADGHRAGGGGGPAVADAAPSGGARG